jgi:uncharacterized protein YjbI with pentapeptide repeats
MFNPELIGLGLEVSDADWRGHVAESMDLSLMVLRDVDLRGARLSNLLAEGTTLNYCNLDGADLSGAKIGLWIGDTAIEEDPYSVFPTLAAGSTWDPGDFDYEQWDEGAFEDLFAFRFKRQSKIIGSSFRGANLSNARLHGIVLEHTDVSGANLQGLNLSGTRIEHVALRGVNLVGACLVGVSMFRVDLSGADFDEADVTGLTLEDVTLDGVTGFSR